MRRLGFALLITATAGCQTFDRQAETPTYASHIQHVSYENKEAAGRPGLNMLMSVPLHKRYDLYCALFPETTTVYRNCQILGLTGVDDDDTGSFSKRIEPRREWFDGMLVLQMSDGRLAYVPPNAVKYFEQTAAAGQATIGANFPPRVDHLR